MRIASSYSVLRFTIYSLVRCLIKLFVYLFNINTLMHGVRSFQLQEVTEEPYDWQLFDQSRKVNHFTAIDLIVFLLRKSLGG